MTEYSKIAQNLNIFFEKKFGKEYGRKKIWAESIDMHPSTLDLYLKGKREPGADILRRLALIDCDINWLLTGERSNTNMVKEETPIYEMPLQMKQRYYKIDLINLLLEGNKITLAEFSRISNIQLERLEEIFSERKIEHADFTALINAVENNRDKFKNALGINFEALRQSKDEYVPTQIIDHIKQISKNKMEGSGVQLSNFLNSSVRDITENNKGVDNKLVNKMLKNYEDQITWLQKSVEQLRQIILDKDKQIQEQRKTIEELISKIQRA